MLVRSVVAEALSRWDLRSAPRLRVVSTRPNWYWGFMLAAMALSISAMVLNSDTVAWAALAAIFAAVPAGLWWLRPDGGEVFD